MENVLSLYSPVSVEAPLALIIAVVRWLISLSNVVLSVMLLFICMSLSRVDLYSLMIMWCVFSSRNTGSWSDVSVLIVVKLCMFGKFLATAMSSVLGVVPLT